MIQDCEYRRIHCGLRFISQGTALARMKQKHDVTGSQFGAQWLAECFYQKCMIPEAKLIVEEILISHNKHHKRSQKNTTRRSYRRTPLVQPLKPCCCQTLTDLILNSGLPLSHVSSHWDRAFQKSNFALVPSSTQGLPSSPSWNHPFWPPTARLMIR